MSNGPGRQSRQRIGRAAQIEFPRFRQPADSANLHFPPSPLPTGEGSKGEGFPHKQITAMKSPLAGRLSEVFLPALLNFDRSHRTSRDVPAAGPPEYLQ